jgi:hypothetical protein
MKSGAFKWWGCSMSEKKTVTSHSCDYDAALPAWKKNRAVASGEDAVKAAGETYLPKPSGLTDAEYAAYKTRGAFFPASGRTVAGYTGLIFRVPPVVEVPAAIETYLDDINLQGLSLLGFAEKAVEDVVVVGRGGILVDMPVAPEGELTIAEREASDLRPFMSFYPAETIVDWRVGRIGSRTMLTFVKLFERVPVEIDFFQEAFAEQYRCLFINEMGEYEVVVYREVEDQNTHKREWVEYERRVPPINGKSENEIPFIFLGSRDASPDIQVSPICDLVSVNLQHYRNAVDYENGLHWTGSPTPIFIGSFPSKGGEDEVTKIRIGSSSGIQMDQGSDAKFLEFQGAGLEGGLGMAMDRKERQMAVLGSRILIAEKKQVEAAETATIHRAGEASVLASLANAISKGITRAIQIVARWANADETVSFALNTDYVPQGMSAQDIQALMLAWQGGGISKRDLFSNLQAGEIINPVKTFEEHEAEIAEEEPAIPKQAPVTDPSPPEKKKEQPIDGE